MTKKQREKRELEIEDANVDPLTRRTFNFQACGDFLWSRTALRYGGYSLSVNHQIFDLGKNWHWEPYIDHLRRCSIVEAYTRGGGRKNQVVVCSTEKRRWGR